MGHRGWGGRCESRRLVGGHVRRLDEGGVIFDWNGEMVEMMGSDGIGGIF